MHRLGRHAERTQPPADPTFQSAWFWQRPGLQPPGFTTYWIDPRQIVRYCKMIVLSGSDNEVSAPAGWSGTWYNAIRTELALAHRSNEKILQYVDMPLLMGPNTAPGTCPTAYQGFTTSWTSRAHDFCDRVNGNEGWFIHNGGGARIHRVQDAGDWWFVFNPGSAGMRSYMQTKLAEIKTDYGMDGHFLDDVWMNANAPRNNTQQENQDGIVAEYAGTVFPPTGSPPFGGEDATTAWHDDMLACVQAIVSTAHADGGRQVGVNSDNHGDISRAADVMMIENYANGFSGNQDVIQADLVQMMTDTVSQCNASKKTILVGSNYDQDTFPVEYDIQKRYFLAAYMMVAHPLVYGRWGADYTRFLFEPEVISWNLGVPLGDRSMISAQTMRRDFTAGCALINMAEPGGATDSNISLGGTYKTPDNTFVTTVTLAPKRGIVLRKA